MKSIYINFKFVILAVLSGIMMLFAFYPSYFEQVPWIARYDMAVNVLILFGIVLYYAGYGRINRILLLVCLFTAVPLISTVVNHVDVKTSLWGRGILLIAMCGGIQWGYHHSEKTFLKTLYFLYYSLLVINLATIYLFPDGMYENQNGVREYNFFLGNYNNFIIYFYMASLPGYLYLKKYKGRLTLGYFLLWAVMAAAFARLRSVTSITGMILLALYGLCLNRRFTRWVLNIKTYMAVNLIFFLTAVWNPSDNLFLRLITWIVGRDMTFSGRTIIWKSVKPYVQEHWLLGNGLETQEVMFEKLTPIHAVQSHNLYLEILYKNGLIGFAVIAVLLFLMLYKLKRIEDQNTRFFIEAYLGVFMLMSQFEAYSIKFVFFMIVFLYFYSSRNQQKTGRTT